MLRGQRYLFLVFFGMVSTAAITSVHSATAPKVIAQWTFEDSGNTALDISDNGHNGILHGITRVASSWGKAASFTGNNDSWIEIPDHADFKQDSAFSIEVFLTVTALPDEHGLVFFRGDNANAGDPYYLSVQPNGTIRLHIESADQIMEELETPIILNKPMHLVGTFSFTEKLLKLYINGVLAASKTTNITPLLELPSPSDGGGVSIGNHTYPGAHYFPFTGTIEELSFYNYALPLDTISAHFKALKLPVDTSKVVAHWSFDSVSNNTYFDVTGHGYDAVKTGDSVRITNGLSGKALECRGNIGESSLNIFDIQVKNSVGNFELPRYTVEAWIYSYVNLEQPGSFYNQRDIFEYVSCSPGIAGGYAMSIMDDGKPFLCWSEIGNGGEPWPNVMGDSVMRPNRWYHLVGTFNADSAKFYVNGRLTGKAAYGGGYEPSAHAARIGCQYEFLSSSNGHTRQFFNGKIDELKLYNYALDAQTIKKNYDSLKPVDERPFKINFGMKITYAKPGDTIWVPIYLTNFENWTFCAAQFNLRINSSQLSLLTISKDSGMVKNWLLDWNRTLADSIPVAVAGTSDTVKYGEGEFLRCQYLVKPNVLDGDTCMITMENIEIDENFHLIDAMTVPGKVIIRNPEINYGDVTGDGRVTVFDARDILSYVVGMITLPDAVNHPYFTKAVADVTGNATISSYDAALVFQYSLGMLPDFPVMHQAPLYKWAAAQYHADVANLSIALASQSSTDGMKFNVTGDNLNGFIAGELAIKYDAGVANIDKGWVGTSLRGANLQSKIDASNRLIKIAMTTNDDITVSDPMVLATITLPPNSTSAPSQAFTIEAAFLNEGKIQTNVVNGGIVGIKVNSQQKDKIQKGIVTLRKNILSIAAGSSPAQVQLFSLSGKLLESKKLGKNESASAQIDMSRYHQGVVVYRVVTAISGSMVGSVVIGR
jgi:hypothetical protein